MKNITKAKLIITGNADPVAIEKVLQLYISWNEDVCIKSISYDIQAHGKEKKNVNN